MENSTIANSRIYSSTNQDIIKKINVSSVLFSMILLIVGIALFVIAWRQSDSSSTLSMSLLTMGTIIVLWSIYRFFWKSKEWVYLPTGSVTKEGSCFFDIEHFSELYSEFDCRKFDGSKQLEPRNSGNIRLDYILSDDHKFAAAQLFKYIPYTYEPASNIFYLKGKEVDDFAKCLSNRKF